MLKFLIVFMISIPAFADGVQTVNGPRGTGYLGHLLGGPQIEYVPIKVDDSLPEAFDWRDHAVLPSIKDQGSCGSCWAFAITKALESSMSIKANKPDLDLSEQELVSCDRAASGCSGGYMESAQYVVDHGLSSEASYPYRGQTLRCKKAPIAAKAVSYKLIGSSDKEPTVDEIKTALYEYGPLFVTVSAGPGWGGTSPEITYCKNRGTNHMVNIVGWTAKGQWIMANSWSSSWGDKGYALMAFGCDQIASEAGFVSVKPMFEH